MHTQLSFLHILMQTNQFSFGVTYAICRMVWLEKKSIATAHTVLVDFPWEKSLPFVSILILKACDCLGSLEPNLGEKKSSCTLFWAIALPAAFWEPKAVHSTLQKPWRYFCVLCTFSSTRTFSTHSLRYPRTLCIFLFLADTLEDCLRP